MSVGRVTMLRKGNSVELARKANTVVVTVPPLVKKSSKSRSFHFRYLELCRAKNLTPVPDIRSKSNSTTTFLELCGDKLAVSDWQLLTEALHYDLVLQQLVVRLRRTYPQSCVNGLQSLPKNKKVTVSQLLAHTKALEEQLSFERTLRKKAEMLNEKLSHQLMRSDSGNLVQEKIIEGGSQQHLNREYVVRNEVMQEVVKDSQSYRQSHFNRLVNSAVTSPEVTPRSEIATLRKEQQLQQQSSPIHIKHPSVEQQLRRVREVQEEVVEEEEEYEEMPLEDSQSEAEPVTEEQQHYQQQQVLVQRKQLQVRKVRSEMKYVENNPKEAAAKNRESKSDHEFANERDFKLNSSVQFETDIGDSAMVNPGQHYENEKDTGYGYNYEQEHPVKRGYEKGYVVGVGDGVFMRRKHSESLSMAEDNGEGEPGGGGVPGDAGSEKLISPREVYLALQLQKREQSS
uniref:Protein Cep78 homolog n=1 Tax=Drosophila rhopaloa TaxID=1041015 RepID=A0A6P4FS80_DRORH